MNSFPQLIFPLVYLLIPFGLFLLFYLIWSAFNVYHLLRFGVSGMGMNILMTFYLGGTVALVAISFTLLSQYDWSTRVNVSDVLLRPEQTNRAIIPTL